MKLGDSGSKTSGRSASDGAVISFMAPITTIPLAARMSLQQHPRMFSLTQGLRRALQTRPNGPSTAFSTRRRTWEQTADRVARVAGALSSLGVQRGDRVAILALNSDRYFELMYALPWIGAV